MPDPLWIRIALGVVLLLLAARWSWALHLERAWRRALSGVPPQLALLWVYQDPRTHSASRAAAQQPLPELSSVDVLFHLSRLDRRQMARFHPRTPATRFEQLIGQFETKDSAPQQGEPEIGERLLAQQLSYDGHDVVLQRPNLVVQQRPADRDGPAPEPEFGADAPQAPGCDAWVDGLRVRLIASSDRALVQQCLDRLPQVVVVTVADHAAAFAEQPRVVALAEVTHAEITQAAEAGTGPSSELPEAKTRLANVERSKEPASSAVQPAEAKATNSLTEIGSLIASQAIPPALYTAYRTAQLAAKGDGSWLAAAKGELVDTAASSVGGWAGGAMLGAILGPVGMVAGGLIGGLLGSKLVSGMTENSREKRLRELLAEQQTLLGRVPRLAASALAAQAQHLGNVADELRGAKAGLELWPSAEKVAREQVAAEYRRWQRRVAKRERQLEAWLKEKHSAEKRSVRGAQLLSDGLPWSNDLLELRGELMQLGPKIEAERARLAK